MSQSPKLELTGLNDHVPSINSKSSSSKNANSQNDDPFSWIEKPFGLDQHVSNIIVIVGAHIFALYYSYKCYRTKIVNPTSILFEIFYHLVGSLGAFVGCHRYWTHRLRIDPNLDTTFLADRKGDTFRWKGENCSTAEIESVISRFEVVVYGVEIPFAEGRAGMAAIEDPDECIDLNVLATGIFNAVPSYARSLFVRTFNQIQKTGIYIQIA